MRYIQHEGQLYEYKEYVANFGKPQKRVQDKPNIINRFFDAYESPMSGETITSRSQRDSDMKAHNCVDYDPSIKAESDRNTKNEQSALELKMDRDIERSISELSSDKQGSLEQELNAGADISVDRQ
jgi:hypothetical protein